MGPPLSAIGPAASTVVLNAAAQAHLARTSAVGIRGQQPRQIIGSSSIPTRTVIGRNDPCPCGSGKKFKRCHLAMQRGTYVRDPAGLPKLNDAAVSLADTVTAPANKNATAVAMRNAKLPDRIVWAYLETGIYMTENNRAAHPPATVAKWEAALAAYDAATPDEQQIMLAPAVDG